MTLPTSYTNATVSHDEHPAAHNDVNAAVNDVEARVVALEGAPGGATGTAGGVLSGSYPNPGFAADMATQAELNAITKTSVGLGNVDNTSDAAKPVSTAQQTALNAKVNGTTRITVASSAPGSPATGDVWIDTT